MTPAIFIDRDGVIIDESHYPIVHPEQVQLLPGVADAIRRLNDAALPVVVVTNQAIIARGFATEGDLRAVHERMAQLLDAEAGARVDAIYFCPHHPNPSQPSRVEAYCIECECRKPRPGLLLQAARDLDLDLSRSYMIGDSTSDIAAGIGAGIKTILLTKSGKGGADKSSTLEPDFRMPTLTEAVDLVLGG